MTLADPDVIQTLAAKAGTTTMADGSTIPYPFPSPADWRDHWIYFLLVDRFNNPLSPPVPDAFPCDTYQGGNFAGIKSQLSYLKELGVGAIWLSPVLINPQWFKDYWGGYGIFDFMRVEPRFCNDVAAATSDASIADAAFRELVDEAHALGIYVILDIVLNHAGDLFNYEGIQDTMPYKEDSEYTVYWRDETGTPHGEWIAIENIPSLSNNEGVSRKELQRNDYFRRKGGDDNRGDFGRFREFVTDTKISGTNIFPVRNYLISAYQYLIAKFDLDGYRIDTLQYIEPEFARVFGNAMREYALSIGKQNFFTFGEVWQDDDEERIAEFIGRNTEKGDELIGVDAAIDFPMRKRLVNVCKGFSPPAELSTHFDQRRETLKKIVSSHGDAGKYYVTFLDNHDLNERFTNPDFPEQTTLALTCLMTMQGVSCIYYGTEQGLVGRGGKREYARQALWSKPDAFSMDHPFYKHIKDLGILLKQQPTLRYGRQYFRTCSGDGINFGYSSFNGGTLAFSRILNDKELLIAANTNIYESVTVHIVIDKNLHSEGKMLHILFPFNRQNDPPLICETHGIYRTILLTLAPCEALVIGA
ncbi:MAG: alpha-amylase family glycosyl hydrolase [Agriterribacter sp.]